jgi:hypothetical protein
VTLISSIIGDAYREANILPLGKAPTANQVTEALRLFNGNIRSIYGGDAGESLIDWPLGTFGTESGFQLPYTDYAIVRPTINQRLIATNTVAKTVYLTPYPQDGSRMGIADPFGRLAAFPSPWMPTGGPSKPLQRSCSTRTAFLENGSIARTLDNGCGFPRSCRPTPIRSRKTSTISSSSAWRCGLTRATAVKWTSRALWSSSPSAGNSLHAICSRSRLKSTIVSRGRLCPRRAMTNSGNFRPIGPLTVVGMGDRKTWTFLFPEVIISGE